MDPIFVLAAHQADAVNLIRDRGWPPHAAVLLEDVAQLQGRAHVKLAVTVMYAANPDALFIGKAIAGLVSHNRLAVTYV